MQGKRAVVIAGGGIIGTCTAYYLSKHSNLDIILIESVGIASGASGKAGGFISKDWHHKPTESLGFLSFELHQQLATLFNGELNWGYRRLKAISVNTKYNVKRVGKSECDWIDKEIIVDSEILGDESTIAQCHPYQFTNFILEQAKKDGVSVLKDHVTRIEKGKVYYTANGQENALDCDDIIVCAGPWTSTILSQVKIQALKAHSITIATEQTLSPFAVFSEMKMESGHGAPEFYARKNEVYVCGEAYAVDVPTDASLVLPEPEKCEKLIKFAHGLSKQLRKIDVRQACLLPVSECDVPLVGKVSDGIYVAAGHGCWGISLAPATGLVLSELISTGTCKSADITLLDPLRYL
jgi:glycine/D-amino acid oxidase-like deaminating enzyme